MASLPEVVARERQTLDRFGFTAPGRLLKAGLWPNLGGPDNRCYHQPVVRLEGSRRNMTDQAAREAAAFRAAGTAPESIACCLLTDEPAGQKLEHLVVCPACLDAFRGWLKGLALSPADLLVADWEAVRFVPPEQRDDAPALHYFTQRFRTRALAEFIAVQTEILRAAYGFDFPMAASISGGNAVYGANFYIQGVDYFELLGHPGVNALWSADWANDASTYQMGAYNAALLQAAARRHGQALGMHVVAQAGRLPWDVKCKAVGQAARGIGMLNSFHYGPTYACGERYPWIANPEMWAPHAEVVREIGAAEDLLLAGRPVPAEVAIVYSSSSDIWTLQRNHAYGFERKHIWLALTHAQIPVDFLSERDVAEGLLAGYRVCYATGPNLTRAAAAQLREWTLRGGTLVLTAGAAAHDEYNRPVDTLDTLLPCGRRPVVERHPLLTPGRSLGDTRRVPTLDTVRIGEAELEVLSLRGALRAGENARIEGVFADGSPAFVSGARGAGRVYCAGFLPGLAYVRAAWLARVRAGEEDLVAAAVDGVDEAVDGDDADRQPDPAPAAAAGPLALSYNPWAFPAGIREAILAPARAAGVDPPVRCSVPVIDAVLLESETGAVLALANWTIREQAAVAFSVRTAKPVRRAESVHQGALTLQAGGGAEPGGGATVRFTLALRETDFVLFQY